jgi:hypothetical protein
MNLLYRRLPAQHSLVDPQYEAMLQWGAEEELERMVPAEDRHLENHTVDIHIAVSPGAMSHS